jgi:peroxiredoxin
MKTQKRWSAVLLVLAAALVACEGPGSAIPRGINQGNQAKDFSLESLDGGKISLSDYEGDVVLVNFWATWCAPCRAEIPDFEAAYQDYKDEGFVVLGVNEQESAETVRPFADALGMNYPILLDEQGQVMNQYRALGLPTSILVDREGVIQVRHTGVLLAAQLESYLADLLRDQ